MDDGWMNGWIVDLLGVLVSAMAVLFWGHGEVSVIVFCRLLVLVVATTARAAVRGV